jgi:plastocyanin
VFVGGTILMVATSFGKAASGDSVLGVPALPAAVAVAVGASTATAQAVARPAAMPAAVMPAAAPPAAVMEVKIDNFKFGPEALTIPLGTTVTWTNRDDIPHTVVSTEGVFKSKVLDTDEKFTYTFAKAGTFDYFCSIHPKMTGKVVVQ